MKHLVSIKISVVLLLFLALSMAVATFVENDFGTLVARAFVYEAWWFELIMIWLSINFMALVIFLWNHIKITEVKEGVYSETLKV